MATTGGGLLLGDLHRYNNNIKETRACTALLAHCDRVANHDFLPSTSQHCIAINSRRRCVSWKPPGQARAGMVQTAAVQSRDVENVSETLLEGIAQELYTKNNAAAAQEQEQSSSGREDICGSRIAFLSDEVGRSVRNDAPMLGYIQTLNALKGQQQQRRLLNGVQSLAGSRLLETGRLTDSTALTNSRQGRGSAKQGGRSCGEIEEGKEGLQELKDVKGSEHSALSGLLNQRRRASSHSKRDMAKGDPRRRIISVARSIDAGSSIESVLGKPGSKFTPHDVTGVLSALRDQRKALELFEWMQKQGKTRGNVFAYNVALKIRAARQEWSQIDKLLEAMDADECEADHYTFNTLIQGASKARHTEHATKCFHLMLKKGVAPNKVTYGTILMLYQKFGKVAEAEFVYSHMVQSGMHSCTAYSAMITLYTRGGFFHKSEQVMEDMRRNDVAPDRDNWLKQLNTYGQQGKVEEAEGVMHTVEQCGMNLGIVGYNSMITAYGKAGLYEKAARLFQKLKESGLQPDEVTYSCMIGACGRAGKLKDALVFFEEMKALQIQPTSSNFSTLINLYGKAGNVVGIIRVIADMKRLGCTPDWQTLDAVVKAYERAGQTKKVTQALGLLREAGWVQEPASYGTLLHIYLKCNLQQEALQIFFAMREADMAPKEYMCRSLICACKDAGMYGDAVLVFKEMQVAGVYPSMESSCTMINVYGLKGDVKEAEGLFTLLRSTRQKLDIIAYNVMINVYMRAGMPDEATKIFKLMEEQDALVPDSYTFHSMLRLCQKCNLPEQAEAVYWKLISSDIELDEVMCNCVINCCGRFLPLEEMHRIFQEMNNAGFVPNNITFNVMIDLYGKAGMLDRARNALKLAQQQGAADKISFSTLINAYGKRQDFPKMEATLWEMQNAGVGGSLEAFNSMLDSYGKASQLEKVEDVLDRMEKAGCRKDLSTYNILINVYGRKCMLDEMENLFHVMQEEGFKPDRWTYNTLIRTYGYADYPDRAVTLFKEMQDAGFLPDRVTYINLVAAFEKSGNLLEAARWSLWMSQAGYTK